MTTEPGCPVTLALPADTKVRGITCYSGKIYVVAGGGTGTDSNVWEISNDGSGAKKLFTLTGISAYQASRYGNVILVVADNGYLYQYVLSAGVWGLGESDNIGANNVGSFYGIGFNSTGTGFWTSSQYYRVSYYSYVNDLPAYAGATLRWESVFQKTDQSGIVNNGPRAIAVDQNDGSIYYHDPISNNTVKKLDKDGNLIKTIGPVIYKADGVSVGTTIGSTYPMGLAVDPLTGYLYLNNAGVAHVVDCSGATPVWKRSIASTGTYGYCFTDDGQKFYCASAGGTEFVRNNAGTALDYTDDTFAKSGVVMNQAGTLTPTAVGDTRGVSVDRNNAVYLASLTANTPIRRYRAGQNALNLEFYGGATGGTWTCSTDAQNNLWTTTHSTANPHLVRCFAGGWLINQFDPATDSQLGGQMAMIACDRGKGNPGDAAYREPRVILGGFELFGTYKKLIIQSRSYDSAANVATGTVSGNISDASTSLPLTGCSLTLSSPYTNGTAIPALGFGSVGGPYSITLPAGTLVNLKASKTGYLPTVASHYSVLANQTISGVDMPLLPSTSDYVKIQLGTHNVEQGLYLKSTKPGTYIGTPNGCANFAANVGGRDCRGFGRPANVYDEMYMTFDVDDSFIKNALPVSTAWIGIDLFNDGPDRFQTIADTASSSATTLGYEFKTGTMQWETLNYYRPDIYFGNRSYGPSDLRLASLCNDGAVWGKPDYISQITISKTGDANSFSNVASIADLKKKVLSQTAGGAVVGGSTVKLTGKIVSAVFADYFYIEEADRQCGIRVLWSGGAPMEGTPVTITGYVTSVPANQELAIQAMSVDAGDPGDALKPLVMTGKTVCGGATVATMTVGSYIYKQQVQPGVSVGTPNVGLLVKIVGKVTAKTSDFFGNTTSYIDDGSGTTADLDDSLVAYKGVKVVGNLSGEVGDSVQVTGVVSLGFYDPTPENKTNGDGWYYPTLLLTGSSIVN